MIHSGFFLSGPSLNSDATTSFISIPVSGGDGATVLDAIPPSFWVRTAMKVSRARWFIFLRRVFHYQNGSRSDLGPNPFDSCSWMVMELVALLFQLIISVITLAISQTERPVWPMRLWIGGYDLGCVLSLLVLYGRHRYHYRIQGDGNSLSDIEHEQQRSNESSRYLQLMNKCRTSLDLFFAIWFVMGNLWVLDSRFASFERAPKLHLLCSFLLVWNVICYSFPFILFLLLCCCVPLISSLIGYNINMGSTEKGALDDQISQLPYWRYRAVHTDINPEPPFSLPPPSPWSALSLPRTAPPPSRAPRSSRSRACSPAPTSTSARRPRATTCSRPPRRQRTSRPRRCAASPSASRSSPRSRARTRQTACC